MDRRRLLAVLGSAGTGGLAACLGREAAAFHIPFTYVVLDEPTRGDVTVGFEVENTGDRSATQEVRLLRQRDVVDSRSVSLGGGEQTTGELTYTPPAEIGGLDRVVVATADDLVTTLVERAAADFRIRDTDVFVRIPNQGDVTALYDIENTGDRSATQEVSLEHEGTILDADSVSLDGDERRFGKLTTTLPAEVGDFDSVVVATEDESVTERVDLSDFTVDLVDAPFGARAGQEVSVTYRLTNQSTVEASQDIVFEVAERQEGVETVSLDARESTTRSVTYLPDDNDVGILSLTISSDDDLASMSIEVAPADADPIVLDGAVRAESVGGFLSFSGDTRAAARQQGGHHPNLAVDGGDPAVTIVGLLEDGRFESTRVDAPGIPSIPGLGVEDYDFVEEVTFDVSTPEGISGEVDYDEGWMTASGLWRFTVTLTMSAKGDGGSDNGTTDGEGGEDGSDGDGNTTEQQFHVDVPMDATTGQSGALTGEFDNEPPVFTATLVDNETTIPAVDPEEADVSPVIAGAINELLGLPSDPGEFWLEVDFRFESIE